MFAVAFGVGGAVATALFAALVDTFHLGTPLPKNGSMDGPYFGLFLRFGLLISALSFSIVKLRQPRGARIAWSVWGITAWDGDAVRCAIERVARRTALADRGRLPDRARRCVQGGPALQSAAPSGPQGDGDFEHAARGAAQHESRRAVSALDPLSVDTPRSVLIDTPGFADVCAVRPDPEAPCR